MAERSLEADGYLLPDARRLRRVIRMFVRSSRRGRRGYKGVRYMLDNRNDQFAQYALADFVVDRLELKEASRKGDAVNLEKRHTE
jgi:hypothetical protein